MTCTRRGPSSGARPAGASAQGGDERGAPRRELLEVLRGCGRAGVERIEPGSAPGVEADRGQPECVGQRLVLALGVTDRDPAGATPRRAESSHAAVDERL